MPENETLFPNSRTANRWARLRERIGRGESIDRIFPEFQQEFYRALRRVFKEWSNRGIQAEELFDAATGNPAQLRELIDRTWNHEYAQLLKNAAAGEPNPTRETVIRSFLDSAWEHIRGLLQVDCRQGGPGESFLCNVQQMLDRLICKLLTDPNRVPRRPPRREPPPDLGDMLGESLSLA